MKPDLRTVVEGLVEEGRTDEDIASYYDINHVEAVTIIREDMEERAKVKDLGLRLLKWAAQTGGCDAPEWRELQQHITGSKLGFNWDFIEKEIELQGWEPQDGCPGEEARQLFIGTVMSLTPSGKVYTPYACSNVEVCEHCANASEAPCCDEGTAALATTAEACNGSTGDPLTGGGHCEVCRDAAWREQLEKEADEHGYYIQHGEGDPCDMFMVETREVEDGDEEEGTEEGTKEGTEEVPSNVGG
jgi:hypothetical protein